MYRPIAAFHARNSPSVIFCTRTIDLNGGIEESLTSGTEATETKYGPLADEASRPREGYTQGRSNGELGVRDTPGKNCLQRETLAQPHTVRLAIC